MRLYRVKTRAECQRDPHCGPNFYNIPFEDIKFGQIIEFYDRLNNNGHSRKDALSVEGRWYYPDWMLEDAHENDPLYHERVIVKPCTCNCGCDLCCGTGIQETLLWELKDTNKPATL